MIDRRRFVRSMIALGAAAGTRRADVLLAFPPHIDAMTPPERAVSGEGIGGAGLALVGPTARIREFTFSSASAAV